MTARVLTLIPSRMASTRFPNKPLALVGGVPMVVRVWQQVQKAHVGDVYIAAADTDTTMIETIKAHGGQVVYTDAALPNGSARIWQAVQRLMEAGEPKPDIIINVQGDEPLLPPSLLQEAVAAFAAEPAIDVVTFAHEITDPADKENPTKVKIATNRAGRALYFSRSPIPHGAGTMLRHIGFYAYSYAALERYMAAGEGTLENIEKLEQLRGLEQGLYYKVLLTPHAPVGVDTPADLEAVNAMLGKA